MPDPFAVRLSEELRTKVEAEGTRQKITASEVVRRAVEDYFNHERSRLSFEILRYEIAKTRMILLRRIDMVDPPELSKEKLIELADEAGKDAEAYIEGRKK